jgi:hypothetical protein
MAPFGMVEGYRRSRDRFLQNILHIWEIAWFHIQTHRNITYFSHVCLIFSPLSQIYNLLYSGVISKFVVG